MNILNKFASRALPATITLVIIQNAFSLLVAIAVGMNAPAGHKVYAFKQPLTVEIAIKWLPAVCLFTAMLVCSMYTLKLTSVATAIVVRSLTPHFTAIFDMIFFSRFISLRTWAALFAILGGAVLFLMSGHMYAFAVYFWPFANLLCAASYAVYVKFVINTIKPSTMDLVLYNNLMSLPLLLCFIWLDFLNAKDGCSSIGSCFETIAGDFGDMSGLEWMWVLLSMGVAGTISFAGFGLAGAVTATTATVCQHSSKIVAMMVSMPVFNDWFNLTQWIGVVITFAGTGWYSFERTMSAKSPDKPKGILKTEETGLLGGGGSRMCGGCIPWV